MSSIKKASLPEMVSRCTRCGFCQDVCPTYASSKNEMDVARGRIRMIHLVQEGRYDPITDKAILNQVDQCLLCGACVENCPSSVPTDTVMRLARENILEKKGFSLFHNLLYRGVLTQPERLEKISALIRILDKTNIRTHVAKAAAKTALSFLSDAATYLPKVMEIPARTILSHRHHQIRQPAICYFLGCGTNAFTPGAAISTMDCLEKLGLSVDVPEVFCCGGPHFSAGDTNKARALARKNIAILSSRNYDAIVSDCATCTHTLHDYASFFPENDPVQDAIKKLTPKITDINTFILAHLPSFKRDCASTAPKNTVRVTYHDPCHAVRGMGVRTAPRDILNALPGVSLVEMEGADSCCGGAGSYSFRHPAMSKKILNRKIAAIEATNAQILVTSCPSCILQLSAGLRRNHLDIKVAHPIELLAEYGYKNFWTQ